MRNTKIVHRVTLKHMKMNARRTLISVIGIALMVMLLTCVFVGKDTVYRYFVDLGAAKSGSYHYAVYNIDRETLGKIKELDPIKEIGVTEDLKYTEFDRTGNPQKPFLNIRRYSAEAMEYMNISVTEGRLPENGDEIVISRSAIEDGSSIKIGDTVDCATFQRFMSNTAESGSTVIQYPMLEIPAGETVELPYNMFYFVPGTEFGDEFYETHEEIHEMTGFTHTYKVVGIIETPGFEEPGCAWYAAITQVDESSLYGDVFNALIITDEKKVPANFVVTLGEIAGYVNVHSNDSVLIFSGNSSDNSLNFIVVAAQVFFVILIVLISIMLIYNVFALSYDERVKYLGMLSSVGATGRQKRSSVYFEAFVLLLPALPAGIAAGLGIVRIASDIGAPMAQKLYDFDAVQSINLRPALEVKPVTVAAVLILSAVTVFISALIPARKISKVGPVESIRGNAGKARKHGKSKNPDKLITGSAEGMLSSRSFRNGRSRSLGIIRAVSIFLLVTTVVYFAASLLMQMVDFKLVDDTVHYKYYEDRDYAFVMSLSGDDDCDPDEVMNSIKEMDGVTDLKVCRSSSMMFYLDNSELSDEYWDALYDILCLYYPEGEFSRETFNENFKERGEGTGNPIDVLVFEDEDFAKIAKKVKAEDYEEGELPCIILDTASISTDSYRIYGNHARDYRYLQINSPLVAEKGGELPIYPYTLTREQAAELGYEADQMAFPEIELDGPLNLKVIAKADMDDLSDYLDGDPGFDVRIIVPMSVAGYMERLSTDRMDVEIYFNCDDEASLSKISLLEKQLVNDDITGILARTSRVAEFKEIMAYLIKIVLVIFTAIASSICLLNVYSSISALMVSKRKSFAVLKSVGSTFRQLLTTELLGSARVLVWSFLVAAPFVAVICLWLSKTLIRRFGYFTVSFPWAYVLIISCTIILSVIIMTIACLRRENKIDIIDEIKRESV